MRKKHQQKQHLAKTVLICFFLLANAAETLDAREDSAIQQDKLTQKNADLISPNVINEKPTSIENKKKLDNLSISTETSSPSTPSITSTPESKQPASLATKSEPESELQYEVEFDSDQLKSNTTITEQPQKFDDEIKEKIKQQTENPKEKKPDLVPEKRNHYESLHMNQVIEIDSNKSSSSSSQSSAHDNNHHLSSLKYCANLGPLKGIFDKHIEPLCTPLVSLLPEDIQVALLDQSDFLLLFLSSVSALFFASVWYTLIRLNERSQSKQTKQLNERLVHLSNRLVEASFATKTYAARISQLEQSLSKAELVANELTLKHDDLLAAQRQEQEFALEELERVKLHLTQLGENNLSELKQRFESETENLGHELASLRDQLDHERQTSERQRQHIDGLILEKNNSSNEVNASFDSLTKISLLEARVKELEQQQLDATTADATAAATCGSEAPAEQSGLLIESLTVKVKEAEIQIRLLNELREKDTKQHLKIMSELDSQLKKKTADADKVAHLLDMIRSKQERIHELEGQFSRIERQSTQEKQVYEKQAHENWLTGRKIERELRDTKQELNELKDKFADLVKENCQLKNTLTSFQNNAAQKLMNPAVMYYMSPQNRRTTETSLEEWADSSQLQPINVTTNTTANEETSLNQNASDQPLNIDTSNLAETSTNQQRPSSNCHSNQIGSNCNGGSGVGGLQQMIPSSMQASFPFMRSTPPYHMFPYGPMPAQIATAYYQQQQQQQQKHQQHVNDPNMQKMSSPNPDYVNRLHPSYKSVQQLQQQQQQQLPSIITSRGSNPSSQQGSPGANSTVMQNSTVQRSASYNPNLSNITSIVNPYLNVSNNFSFSNFNVSTIPNENDSSTTTTTTNNHNLTNTNNYEHQINSAAYVTQPQIQSPTAFFEPGLNTEAIEEDGNKNYNENFSV